MKKPFQDLKVNQLHLGYVIFFLLSLLILVATRKFASQDMVVKYLEFGLALTSFTVSVFAILQTLFSQSSLEESLSKVHNASSLIEASASRLERDLSSRLQSLESEIAKNSGLLRELSQSTDSSPTDVIPPDESLTADLVDTFLTNASVLGLCSLRVAVLSKTRQKEFKLSEIFSEVMTARYMHGFLVASSSIGLFRKNYHNGTWWIIAVNTYLEGSIETKISEKLARLRPALKPEADQLLQSINSYFAISNPQ